MSFSLFSFFICLQLCIFPCRDKMSQKRKGKSLLEKVAKLAKASQESEKFDEEKSQYFKQMESAFERQNETESKDAFFSRVYNDSSPLDRVLEFLILNNLRYDSNIVTLPDFHSACFHLNHLFISQFFSTNLGFFF